MRSVIETDENGDLFFKLPEPLIKSGRYLPDDQIEMSVTKDKLFVKNLSCYELRQTRFRRNLNRIMKILANNNLPLKRILIIRKGRPSSWCLPHDKTLRPEFFDYLNQQGDK